MRRRSIGAPAPRTDGLARATSLGPRPYPESPMSRSHHERAVVCACVAFLACTTDESPSRRATSAAPGAPAPGLAAPRTPAPSRAASLHALWSGDHGVGRAGDIARFAPLAYASDAPHDVITIGDRGWDIVETDGGGEPHVLQARFADPQTTVTLDCEPYPPSGRRCTSRSFAAPGPTRTTGAAFRGALELIALPDLQATALVQRLSSTPAPITAAGDPVSLASFGLPVEVAGLGGATIRLLPVAEQLGSWSVDPRRGSPRTVEVSHRSTTFFIEDGAGNYGGMFGPELADVPECKQHGEAHGATGGWSALRCRQSRGGYLYELIADHAVGANDFTCYANQLGSPAAVLEVRAACASLRAAPVTAPPPPPPVRE